MPPKGLQHPLEPWVGLESHLGIVIVVLRLAEDHPVAGVSGNRRIQAPLEPDAFVEGAKTGAVTGHIGFPQRLPAR